MAEIDREKPYAALGTELKSIRVGLQETIADVAGSVEIDADMLLKIEAGLMKPSEDILLLLLSHLSVQETEANKLWQMAGYEKHDFTSEASFSDLPEATQNQQMVMVMPHDTRVQYTDMVNVTVNNYGVVMNFLQKADHQNNQGQPQLIARMGMSKEHARSVIKVLQHTLDQAEKQHRTLPKHDGKKSV